MPRHGLLLLLLLPLLPACTAPVDTAVLWGGYSYEWERLSHRISRLRSGVDWDGEAEEINGELGVVGGPWSTGEILVDEPHWELRWRTVQSRSLSLGHGAVDLTIPAEGRAEATVRVPLADIDDRDDVTWAVAIQGFDLDMDVDQAPGGPDYDPAFGWTPQGFGVGLGQPAVEGDELVFDAWMHFRAGPLSCDPGGDCEEMNAAIPFAQVAGQLRWTVLAAAPGSDAAVGTERLQTGRYYEAGEGNTPHPPIDPDNRTLVFAGEPGRSLGLPLLRSWDFELNRHLDDEGRYLRDFSAGIEDFVYDSDTGEATVIIDAFCSIESAFEEGDLEVEFTADVDLLQLDDPSGVTWVGLGSGMEEAAGVFDQVVEPDAGP